LQRSPDSLAVFKGPASKGREWEGEEKGRGGKRKGRVEEGKEGEGCPQLGSLDPPVRINDVVLSFSSILAAPLIEGGL